MLGHNFNEIVCEQCGEWKINFELKIIMACSIVISVTLFILVLLLTNSSTVVVGSLCTFL